MSLLIQTNGTLKIVFEGTELLDGIVPNEKTQEYTLVLLATPVLDVKERKTRET